MGHEIQNLVNAYSAIDKYWQNEMQQYTAADGYTNQHSINMSDAVSLKAQINGAVGFIGNSVTEFKKYISKQKFSSKQRKEIDKIKKSPRFKKIIGESALLNKDELEKLLDVKISSKGLTFQNQNGPVSTVKTEEEILNDSQECEDKLADLLEKGRITETQYKHYFSLLNAISEYYLSELSGEQIPLKNRPDKEYEQMKQEADKKGISLEDMQKEIFQKEKEELQQHQAYATTEKEIASQSKKRKRKKSISLTSEMKRLINETEIMYDYLQEEWKKYSESHSRALYHYDNYERTLNDWIKGLCNIVGYNKDKLNKNDLISFLSQKHLTKTQAGQIKRNLNTLGIYEQVIGDAALKQKDTLEKVLNVKISNIAGTVKIDDQLAQDLENKLHDYGTNGIFDFNSKDTLDDKLEYAGIDVKNGIMTVLKTPEELSNDFQNYYDKLDELYAQKTITKQQYDDYSYYLDKIYQYYNAKSKGELLGVDPKVQEKNKEGSNNIVQYAHYKSIEQNSQIFLPLNNRRQFRQAIEQRASDRQKIFINFQNDARKFMKTKKNELNDNQEPKNIINKKTVTLDQKQEHSKENISAKKTAKTSRTRKKASDEKSEGASSTEKKATAKKMAKTSRTRKKVSNEKLEETNTKSSTAEKVVNQGTKVNEATKSELTTDKKANTIDNAKSTINVEVDNKAPEIKNQKVNEEKTTKEAALDAEVDKMMAEIHNRVDKEYEKASEIFQTEYIDRRLDSYVATENYINNAQNLTKEEKDELRNKLYEVFDIFVEQNPELSKSEEKRKTR